VRSELQSLTVGITPGIAAADVSDEDAINIVVTAEKTPEDPLDVPISLTVLTEDELEDAQINSIRDVAANTPNFFTSVGDRAFNFYSIRGNSNSNFLVRDSVGFYLDDVPIEYFHQLFPGDLFDLEQVEVLRGPQNTLYGRNSIAGVVNVTRSISFNALGAASQDAGASMPQLTRTIHLKLKRTKSLSLICQWVLIVKSRI
jgi:iron complex outermembrane receptor protein